jgi:hypothetical protein
VLAGGHRAVDGRTTFVALAVRCIQVKLLRLAPPTYFPIGWWPGGCHRRRSRRRRTVHPEMTAREARGVVVRRRPAGEVGVADAALPLSPALSHEVGGSGGVEDSSRKWSAAVFWRQPRCSAAVCPGRRNGDPHKQADEPVLAGAIYGLPRLIISSVPPYSPVYRAERLPQKPRQNR